MNGQSTHTFRPARKPWRDIARILVIAVPACGAGISASQDARPQPSDRFEVASVKRVDIPAVTAGVPVFPVTGGVGTSNPLRITYHGAWLEMLIAEAFGVRADAITGPDWLRSTRYDIIANIPPGATKEQFRVMLGNLLRDRFGLRFHVESKSQPIFALRVGKNGSKLRPAAPRSDTKTSSSDNSRAPDEHGCLNPSPNFQGLVSLPGRGEMCWTGQDVPIEQLAHMLEPRARRPVVDETGLTGRYDFKIYFASGRLSDASASAAPSVFTAVEEQLGLKLEPSTISADQIIIDSINREPTDN